MSSRRKTRNRKSNKEERFSFKLQKIYIKKREKKEDPSKKTKLCFCQTVKIKVKTISKENTKNTRQHFKTTWRCTVKKSGKENF